MRNKMYYYRVRLIAYIPFYISHMRFSPRIPTPNPTPFVFYQRGQRRPLRKVLLIRPEDHCLPLEFSRIV